MNGPWRWSDDGCYLFDSKGVSVLRLRPSDATQEEFNAIAALPELLEACKAAIKHAETCRDTPEFTRGYYIGRIKGLLTQICGGSA